MRPDPSSLSSAELTAITARWDAVLGEQWAWDSYNRIITEVPYGHPWDRHALQHDTPPGCALIAIVEQAPADSDYGDLLVSSQARAHAQAIASAPVDVKRLLAEVQRLRAIVGA